MTAPGGAVGVMVDLLKFLLGGGSAGLMLFVCFRAYSRFLDHREARRKQSDNVALDMVMKQAERIDKLEGDLRGSIRAHQQSEEICRARIDALKHRSRNTEASVDSLLSAMEYAPDDRIGEVMKRFATEWKQRRARWATEDAAERGGTVAHDTQAAVSEVWGAVRELKETVAA